MRMANRMLAQFHFKSSSVIRCSSGKVKYQPPDGRASRVTSNVTTLAARIFFHDYPPVSSECRLGNERRHSNLSLRSAQIMFEMQFLQKSDARNVVIERWGEIRGMWRVPMDVCAYASEEGGCNDCFHCRRVHVAHVATNRVLSCSTMGL